MKQYYQFLVHRHGTGEIVEGMTRYQYPHTAWRGAKRYLETALQDRDIWAHELITLTTQDAHGRLIHEVGPDPARSVLEQMKRGVAGCRV